MKNILAAAVLATYLLSPFLAGATATSTSATTGTHVFSQQDLTALTQPGVVRIIHHVGGTIVVDPFKVDFKTGKLSPAPNEGKPVEIPFDDYLSGTGFFITPDGYILTNGHVVSDDYVRLTIAAQVAVNVAIAQAIRENLSQKDGQAYADMGSALTYAETMDNRRTLLGFFKFKNASSTVTVLDPTQKGSQQVKVLVKSGFPATVKQVGQDFPFSDNDVALIKIAGSSFPALPLAKGAEGIKTSDRVYTFGFPAAADENQISLDSSFTDGSVSARKDSDSKNLSLIETNTKISEGSSGSPLLDTTGNVVGIVSMESTATLGDNFGFAIPIEIAKPLFTKEGITPQEGQYGQSLRAGFGLTDGRHCKKALDAFNTADQSVDPKIAVSSFVDPYLQTCNDMIKSGKSIDTKWDEIKDWLANLGARTWLTIGGAIIATIILSIVITLLVRRIRKEDKEIDQLENMMMHDHFAKEATALNVTGAAAETAATPVSATVPPDLVAYVRQMRAGGFSDENIRVELKKAGWDDAVIERAVASVL